MTTPNAPTAGAEAKDALLCEIAQAAIRAVDSPNFNGPRYRTALRQIAALAATQAGT